MLDRRFDLPTVPAPDFPVRTIDEAMQLAFLGAGVWLHAIRGLKGTPVGYGCRAEGPHGPVPCGSMITEQGGPECDCGCSAFEDACAVYLEWHQAKYPAVEKEAAA